MESLYSHILVATDLGPQSYYIAQRALILSKQNQAKFSVLHVIEPPLTYATDFAKREKELTTAQTIAQKSLSALSQQLGINSSLQKIAVGTPQNVIVEYAKQHHCDLIVVGSHGIGGYTHSLGSTTHYIMSQAPCDVFIIQVTHLQATIEKMKIIPGEYLWQPYIQQKEKTHNLVKEQTPKLGGSIKGFGEEIRRGPRPTLHPGNTPYKGGTRTRTSEEDNDADKDQDPNKK